jgi:hypothetical protein
MVQTFLHHLAADFAWYLFSPRSCLFRVGGVNPIFYYFSFGGLRNASLLLKDTTSAELVESHKKLRSFRFDLSDGRSVVSINTREFGEEGRMKRPENCGAVLDFNGNVIEEKELKISYLPMYLVFNKGIGKEAIGKSLSDAEYTGLGVPVDIDFAYDPVDKKMLVELSNPGASIQNGSVSFKSFSSKIKLPPYLEFALEPKSRKTFKFDCPETLGWQDDDRIEHSIANADSVEKRLAKLASLPIPDDSEEMIFLPIGKERLVKGKDNEFALNGFQAEAGFAWSKEGLSIKVKIKDSEQVFGGAEYGKSYGYDSLQIYFDQMNNAIPENKYDLDDVVYQIGLTKEGNPVAWLEKNPSGRYVGASNTPRGIDSSVKIAFNKTNDGYEWDCFFPQETLPQVKFSKGSALGIGVMIWDKGKDGKRNGYIIGNSVKEECYRKPYNWKMAVFK